MRRFHLFRSNIRNLEYYHDYRTFDEFERKCHDFYLMMGVQFLKNDDFDEVIIWRLKPKKPIKDITFDINGKKFIQKWVDSFDDVLNHPKPTVTFWRGGFKEYDKVTKNNHEFFSPGSLYLAAGRRIVPEFGGIYDKILIESNDDLDDNRVIFYKTCNPEVFKPLDMKSYMYDLCLVGNFTQKDYKGQEFFIQQVSESDYLSTLKIVHIGNKPEIGKKLCDKYDVDNIEFKGWVERPAANTILNVSRFGVVCSNKKDGCPRVSTEVLCSGTPLLIRDKTRIPNYYKKYGTLTFNDNNLEDVVYEGLLNFKKYRKSLHKNIERLSMKSVCKKNIKQWKKFVAI